MEMVMPSNIVDDVIAILSAAARGRGTQPCFLTSYQILDRPEPSLRTRLIDERTLGGIGSGTSYSAASVVSDAAEMIPGVIIDYADTGGLQIVVGGRTVIPGSAVCGVYRLKC